MKLYQVNLGVTFFFTYVSNETSSKVIIRLMSSFMPGWGMLPHLFKTT